MNSPKYNILVLGVCCFDGMASTMRVRNLIQPLIEKNLIQVYNLIYAATYEGKGIPPEGTIDKIRFNVIGFRFPNIFSFVHFFFKGLKLIKKNKSKQLKNILYNFDYPDIKNIFFLIFAKVIGYKIVFDIIEDNQFIANYSGFLNRFRMLSSKVLLKMSPGFTNSYIVISSHLYNKIASIASTKIPVYLIPVSVNFKYFKKTFYNYNNGNIKIFYGGSFGKKDGLPYLIDAFDELCSTYNNLTLILSGKGLPSDMEEVFTRISILKSKDKIVYKGYLDTDDYYTLLNDCDIFCMTRINSSAANSGFPFKLGEFLAAGKAVIATDIGEVSRYLKDGQDALLIRPESVADIVDALKEIIQHPDKILSLGTESRKTAEHYFDSSKLSMQLLDIFQTIK